MIAQEELFDGFYAICTGLEDDAPAIIKANAGRWIIENALHGSAGFRTDKQIVTRKEMRCIIVQTKNNQDEQNIAT